MKDLIKRISAFLLAAGIAVSVSGCGVLTTKNIIQKDETQTKTEKVDTEKKEEQAVAYELATLVPASDILAEIPYIGNRSICKMDKAMALAYKDAIESMPEHNKDNSDYNLCALLADPAGDGMPILITAYVYPEKYEYSYCDEDSGNFMEMYFWEYRDGKAKRVDIPSPDYDNGFGTIGNKTYYRNVEFAHDIGPKRTGVYYLIENATITLKHTIDSYIVETSQGNREGYGTLPEGVSYGYDPEELRTNGWRIEGNENGSIGYLFMHNGKNVTDTYFGYMHDEYISFTQKTILVHADDANYHLDVPVIKGADLAENLEKYAKSFGRPSYRYSQVAENLDSDKVNGIVKAVKGIIAGRIGEVYQLGDDLYYVIMYADDELAGGILLKNTNGGKSWRIVSSGSEALSEPELDNAVESDLRTPNIKIDTKTENVTDAIKTAIANVDGTAVNDSAKNYIADYISHCIAVAGKRTVKASRNTVKITEKILEKCIKPVNEKREELAKLLNENDIRLNKEIKTNILIECTKADAEKEIKIEIDSDVAEKTNDFDMLTVKFAGTPYSIRLDSQMLSEIATRTVTISIEKTGENTFVIRFIGEDGELIENLGTGVTFTLPAENEYCTVELMYKGGTDNWGGQYDEQNKALMFETQYSGTCTILDNKTEISDINELDADKKKAIEFLVSKGYMTLDGDKFNPADTLTRYQFTQALVGMFFALDREVQTTFADVPAESEYYAYVASAQKDDIVEGFTDTEFAGDLNMTTEQMVALAGRTLIKYKDYTAPEDADKYLSGFADKDNISDWARDTVAIAVREGLVDRTNEFGPQNPITREQAAEILYRLFLLLYETEPQTEAVAESVDITKIVVVSVCSVVAIVCIVLIIILIRKRKK